MAKPTKNRIMCPDCGKPKMLFETEKEAQNFIKWNSGDMEHSDKLRPYYCPACCGYHISHKKHFGSFDHRTENMLNDYRRSLTHNDSFQKKLNKTSNLFSKQAKIDEILSEIKPETILKYGKVKNFLKSFMADWWKSHEKYDGWEDVDRIVREMIKRKYNNLKR